MSILINAITLGEAMNMANHKSNPKHPRFPHKLSGATASLFASVCVHYIAAVDDSCNGTPEENPIFSWLSPQQRLSLVHEVARGIFCPGEPSPPKLFNIERPMLP